MKRTFVILLLITFINSFASAIYPKALRVLTKNSELITYGKVLKIYTTSIKNDFNFNEIAEVETIEILKGKSQSKIIKILYKSGVGCPPSPKFTLNTNVLAFLFYKNGNYISVGFSSGVKTLKQNEFEAFKSRIIEINEINNINDEKEQNLKVKDWAFVCLSDSITKSDGVWELKREEIINILTVENKEIIKQLLFSNHEFDYSCDFVFADIIKTENQNEVDKLLLKNLLLVESKDIIYVFEDYFMRLEHLGNKELNTKLKEQFEKYMDYGEENENKMMSTNKEFIKNITN